MTKKLSIELTYDAPLSAVTAMLADPSFREQVCAAQNATQQSVTINGIPGTVEILMTQATQGVPAFAQKLVGSEVQVRQAETWSSPTAATLTIDSGVGAAKIDGVVTLAERGAQTVETIDLTIDVKVPLLGGKLESLVGDLMSKAFTKEGKVGAEYLAG